MSLDLFDLRKNHHSQNGEDGIIEHLLLALGAGKGFFVEFGAWDGKHWSNTHNLIDKGWKGCLIEADKEKFAKLQSNIKDPGIIKINRFIARQGPDSLDAILHAHGIGRVDLLSIDIDSDDLAIWESVAGYSPAIVVIEYNPTIPFDTRYINPPGAAHGNSALSIVESAERRFYTLVEGTDTNLIFVRKDALKASQIRPKTLQAVHDQTFQLRYFFSQDGMLLHTYDALAHSGVTELFPVPWAFTFAVQPIPRILRTRSDRINLPAVAFSLMAAAIRCPLQLIKLACYFLGKVFSGKSPAEILALLGKKEQLTNLLKGKQPGPGKNA